MALLLFYTHISNPPALLCAPNHPIHLKNEKPFKARDIELVKYVWNEFQNEIDDKQQKQQQKMRKIAE